MPDRLLLICAVIDVATSEKPRSMKEFLRQPRLPIREMYLTRVVINLVYFARNYLNFVLLFVGVSAFVFPMILLVLGTAIALHLCKTTGISSQDSKGSIPRKRKVVAVIAQIASCLYVTQQYGFFRLLVVNALPMLLVAAHAALTPYTDEAMVHYEHVMASKGFHAPAPRSPTKDFDHVDKMFEGAIVRHEDNRSATANGVPAAPLSPRKHRTPLVTGAERRIAPLLSSDSPGKKPRLLPGAEVDHPMEGAIPPGSKPKDGVAGIKAVWGAAPSSLPTLAVRRRDPRET